MNPHYIIDGYNLIHRVPRFKKAMEQSLEYSRDQLISFIRAYQSKRKVQITLVFDGANVGVIDNRAQSTSRLKILYSNSPEKADPLIKRLINKANNKKSLILISDDSDLINHSLDSGAKVKSTTDFFEQASKHRQYDQLNKKYNHSMSKDELAEWMNLFGDKKK